MAAFGRITDEKNNIKQYSPENLAVFLKSKKLDNISLILLDILIPFQRPVKAVADISEPLGRVLLGQKTSEKINSFFSENAPFDLLKKALERGEE